MSRPALPIVVASVAFTSILALACGGQTISDPSSSNPNASNPTPAPLACGGDSARVTPTGNTYDDQKGSSSVTAIRFDMFVYADATSSANASETIASPMYGGPCKADGLVAHGPDPVEIAPGAYWLCVDVGACNCVHARLEGGPASFLWEAGPGGGFVSVNGCAKTLR